MNKWIDMGTDVTTISPKSWHLDWPLQWVNIYLLGIGILSQVKQSTRWVECIGSEGQIGKLKPYVANRPKNLWECDLFQQWKTQVSIPPILETNCKIKLLREILKHIIKNSHRLFRLYISRTQPLLAFQRINSPTFRMVKWQTSVGGTMTSDFRKIRTASTGTAKCSTYWIDQSLEFSCICY